MSNAELDSVRHVALSVSNLDSAIEWYQTSFSCEVISRAKTKAVLQFANLRLVLVLPSSEQAHVAFEKTDAASYGELKDRGDGAPSTYVSDACGNLVKLVAKS